MSITKVFTTNELIADIDDNIYCVKILNNANPKVDDFSEKIAYVFGDYVFPYRGDYYKYKLKKVGMYNKDGELYMIMPEDEKEGEKYSINRVKELDPVSILRTIRENSDSYITQEQIDVTKTINALIPNIINATKIAGERDNITSRIIFCVVCLELTCGAVDILYIVLILLEFFIVFRKFIFTNLAVIH